MKEIKIWDHIHNNGYGTSIEKIDALESKLNIKFPKGYKKYLLSTGDMCRPFGGLSHAFENLEEFQTDAIKLMKESDLDVGMIDHPFFVFAILYDSDSFFYFHLDEGDNPAVRSLGCVDYAEGDLEYFGVIGDNFIDWVNARIDNYDPKYDE